MSTLALDDEQRMLRDTVRDLLTEHSPVSAVRRLRDDPDSIGYDPKVWGRLTELGAIELLAPGTAFEAGIVARELGRNLVPSPFLAVAAALHCLQAAGVAAPDGLVVLAHQEGAHHSDRPPATTAVSTDDGYVLNGVKDHVSFGAEADTLVVSATLDGGTALFLVDGAATGRRSGRLIDTRHRARVELADTPATLLSADGSAALAPALTHATALLAAEMLGSAEAALELTISHLQQREQFGVLIGTFQALQHRAARLYVELELGTSLALEALRLLDADDEDAPVAVSAAKAFLNDVALAVASEGAQLHGGMGMTDEADIGLYLKRARVAAQELGDSAFHHRLVAASRGL